MPVAVVVELALVLDFVVIGLLDVVAIALLLDFVVTERLEVDERRVLVEEVDLAAVLVPIAAVGLSLLEITVPFCS